MQGNSQLVRSSQGEVSQGHSTLSKEEPGIELASFQLPINPLYLLSSCSLWTDLTWSSIFFLRFCTRKDSWTLMTSRLMDWKRRRASQARAYFCRTRAFCNSTI